MNKVKILIVNTKTFPVLWTLNYTFQKFANGFVQLGYQKGFVKSDEELMNIADEENTILIFSNHCFSNKQVDCIGPLKKFKKALKILWFFHDFIITNGDIELDNWILTGEHWRDIPKLTGHKIYYDLQSKMDNYVPLTFSSFLPINEIGKNKKNIIWDSQFVGSGYKKEWTSQISNSFVRNIPPFISEEQRVESFINSLSSMGFHSNENIQNNCVVERVPEALSFGCVVFTDNKIAEEITGGIVEYVESLQQLKDKIKFYKNNEHERYKKELSGYEWCRKYGTYTHVAQNFLNKSKEIKNA